ncbi:MAG: hypothetical protein ACRBCL_01610 [Maritimibacter sp.]
MKLAKLFTLVLIGLLPATAYAGCTSDSHAAASCKQGFVWDMKTSACVETVSG